jgi:hypothetical protein
VVGLAEAGGTLRPCPQTPRCAFPCPLSEAFDKARYIQSSDAAVPLPTLSLYQMDDDGRLFAVKPEPELPDVEFIQSGLTLTQGNEGQFWYLSP